MKKTIYGVILAVFFGLYIFFGNEFGGVNAKALTIDDIQTIDDLKNTQWKFKEASELVGYDEQIVFYSTSEENNTLFATYQAGNEVINIQPTRFNDSFIRVYSDAFYLQDENIYQELSNGNIIYMPQTAQNYGLEPRLLTFLEWEETNFNNARISGTGDFIEFLKANATLQEPEPEEYQVEINWPVLEETMILTQGETVTINFDELMQTYKNYEYVEKTWSYNDNGVGNITLPLYYKLTGFYLTNTPVYSEDLFIDSGTLTFTQNIYLWAVSVPPENYIFTKFSYIDDSLEGSVEDGYNLLIPFSDNEVNINWTYDDDMIVDITGLEGYKIAISRFDETSIDIIEYSYTDPQSIQFYINKLGYYFNKVEANAYRYWYNTNTSPWEPPYLNDYYKFNPQEDIEYYDLTNRSTNISVYDDEPTAILYITQEVNYNYEGGGNEGDQLNGAMITFFSLITGLINLKFGFISIGGILAILFGVALLTFIFKIWNGNNNG